MSKDVDWHYRDKLNEAVHRYYAKYASHSPQFEQARLLHLQVLEDIRKHLTAWPDFTHRLEQIADAGVGGYMTDDFESRVHFIMRPVNDDAVKEDVAFFNRSKATLRANSESELGELLEHTLSCTGVISRLCTGDRCISPIKAASLISSLVQSYVDQSAVWRGKIRLVCGRGDSVVRMEVYPDAGWLFWGRLACTVIFVPYFEVKDHTYVSQLDNGQSASGHQWIRSFAVDERKKLELADEKDHGCRKMVLTTLNILRSRVPALRGMNAYYLKTALFREMDEMFDWSSRYVGCRLMGVLQELERAASVAKLPHYFMPDVNLLSGLSWADTSALSPFGFVRCLINSESEKMNVLQQ